jgi:hypothetical protein
VRSIFTMGNSKSKLPVKAAESVASSISDHFKKQQELIPKPKPTSHVFEQQFNYSNAKSPLEETARKLSQNDLMNRVNRRPETFKRLDDFDVDLSRFPSEPLDKEAAEVLEQVKMHQQKHSDQRFVVQKLMPSGPVPEKGDEIHDVNETTLANFYGSSEAAKKLKIGTKLTSLTSKVEEDAGTKSFALYKVIQSNPALLDTAEAISRSSVQFAAAALAAGKFTDSLIAAPEKTPDEINQAHRKKKLEISNGSNKNEETKFLDHSSEGHHRDELVKIENSSLKSYDETANGLLSMSNTIEDALLLAKRPEGVTAWGRRPSEGSAYDQLILYHEDEELMLDRNEIFELFARNKANPSFWTPERLADYFNTKVEWVNAILEFTSPPIYADVDGETYGVYEIRGLDEMHKLPTSR